MLVQWMEPRSTSRLRNHNALDHLFDRSFDDLFSGLFSRPQGDRRQSPARPAINVYELPEAYVLEALLPGADEDDLEIEVTGPRLTIKARAKEPAREGFVARHRERTSLALERTFQFSRPIICDDVSAELKNGRLTVTVPKRPEPQPRKITVSAA
jgi:HSP20 family protein